MKIILATKNEGKIKEFEKLTEGMNIEVLSILDNIDFPDVVEDGKTFEENSAKKAKEIAEYTGITTVSDDSGLCVDTLNGEPGIYSARYSGENATDESNMEKLLKNLSNTEKKKRKAYFVSVVSIAFPDGSVKSFRGETEGEILFQKEGNNGFGYDPIFYSYDLKKSFGNATPEEKKSVSHRGRAFQKLKKEILEKL
ncbi:XTP/dITP diphosphatase [Pseudoleptotrichia goodfellowii]|uniref:dITP/XTP pyrophosphatase n=1 Tax=Pseudoleptotrichia goodfellowii TaxID=157692 RepID=A0A510J9U8_9FUSO|nr:XTP/dITP diphosphatase [Pseudoleptotrichia goodfellowii]BBM35967.1 RdgB/HAM1 family non-canonical purine NTP pyrophosphatase [Pseudoleptotrichia goodfellowii]